MLYLCNRGILRLNWFSLPAELVVSFVDRKSHHRVNWSGNRLTAHTHTHRQQHYRNPRCTCTPRVNNAHIIDMVDKEHDIGFPASTVTWRDCLHSQVIALQNDSVLDVLFWLIDYVVCCRMKCLLLVTPELLLRHHTFVLQRETRPFMQLLRNTLITTRCEIVHRVTENNWIGCTKSPVSRDCNSRTSTL